MSAERPLTADEEQKPAPREEESELDKKLAQYGQIGLPIVTVVVAVVADVVQGPAAAVLVLTGGVLIAVIALLWASVRTLIGETPLSGADAYALGAPRVEEEQKRALLRALKDLEFEHGVGKISDEDYRELTAKYRAEAKILLRQIDAEAQPRRAQVEALVNKRLRKEGLLDPDDEEVLAKAASAPSDDAKTEASEKAEKGKKRKKGKAKSRPADDAADAPDAADVAEGTRVCTACSTVNDADAVFCKKCGARQGDAAKSDAAKSDAAKSGDAKSDAAKSDAAKSDAAKSGDAKSGDAKSGDAKSDAAKSATTTAKADDDANDDDEEEAT